MKKDILFNIVYNCCIRIVTIISAILVLFLSSLNMIYNVFIAMNSDEIPVITHTHPSTIIGVILFLICILFVAPPILDKVTEKQLFKSFSVLYLILGFYLIFNMDASIRADALVVNQAAKEFSNGDFSYLNAGGYMFRYPYQLGLVSFFRLLMKFSSNIYFLFFLYLLFVIAINYVLWKISELYFTDNALSKKILIMLSFLFVPQLFFICFLYGTIPGLLCVLLSVLYFTKYFKCNKLHQCLFGIVFMTLACILRNNYIIAGIAMCIILFLWWLRKRTAKNAVAIAILLLGITFCNKIVITSYEYESGKPINSGTPMSTYIAMGLQGNEDLPSKNGWYNGYVWCIYDEVNFDNKLATDDAINSIQKSIDEFISNPSYMLYFFGNKIKTTWCEPTFQSVWSGPLTDCDQNTYTPILQSIYRGEKGYYLINYYEKVFLIVLLLFSFLGIVFKLKWKEENHFLDIFCETYLIGGFLFHLMWEIKSQYVYPYIFLLIPVASTGVTYMIKLCEKKLKFKKAE